MFDFDRFLCEPKACLIAPAGSGKTYTIVECLKRLPGRQLVVTHTHAGVAALREKIRRADIPKSKYELETIASIAQKIALAFSLHKNVPLQENSGDYFPWIIKRATELASRKFVRRMIVASYKGVVVDEYQDCSINQHEFLMAIAGDLPIRIMGDPLQGIFGFRDEHIVNLEKDLSDFQFFELTEPRRWEKTNPALGTEIAYIRTCLLKNERIDYGQLKEINRIFVSPDRLNVLVTKCGYDALSKGESLIIVSGRTLNVRKSIAKLFRGRCVIVEAIDDKEFYQTAKCIDKICDGTSACKIFYELACGMFFKTDADEWLTEKGAKIKRKPEEKVRSARLFEAVQRMKRIPSLENLRNCLHELKSGLCIPLVCHEKFDSVVNAIEIASSSGVPVLEAMRMERNRIRLIGRRLGRLSVGTTLLTKGLEFDNVIIIDCNPGFNLTDEDDRKNFYVAISRAKKSLTIICLDK